MLLCGEVKDERGKLDGGLMAGGGSTCWLGKGTCRSGDESRTVVSMGFSDVFSPRPAEQISASVWCQGCRRQEVLSLHYCDPGLAVAVTRAKARGQQK